MKELIMLSKVAQEYLLIEFSEDNAGWLVRFLTNQFFEKGETSWTGNVIVLEIDAETQIETVADLFCERPDELVPWKVLVDWIYQERGLTGH